MQDRHVEVHVRQGSAKYLGSRAGRASDKLVVGQTGKVKSTWVWVLNRTKVHPHQTFII